MLPIRTNKPDMLSMSAWQRCCRVLRFGTALALLAGSLAAPAYAIQPGVPGTVFELDRNAVDNTGAPFDSSNNKDDWANVLDSTPTTNVPIANGSIIATTVCSPNGNCVAAWPGVLPDPPGFSLFVQGSKDLDDITGWTCRDQKAPDKDEITNAYAIAYKVPDGNGGNDLLAFFGADRFDNAGTATMGFWLLQTSIPQPNCLPTGDGKFLDALGSPAVHSIHDLLVVADFTNGGAIGTVRVFEWVGFGGSDGALNKIFDSAGNPNVDCSTNNSGDVCGTINQATTSAPWPYQPKGASTFSSTFITFGFMEIGINLTNVFQGSVPCFSTFVAETRSSSEPNASQKDFVMGSFNVCGIDVSKSCTNNQVSFNPLKFTFDVGGCITNTGFGAVTNFGLTDSPPFKSDTLKFYQPKAGFEPTAAQCEQVSLFSELQAIALDPTKADPVNSSATIQPGKSIIWLANIESSTNGGTDFDTVTATAHAVNGPLLAPVTDKADCPVKTFNPVIEVTKTCTVFLEEKDGKLVVKSTLAGTVCNKGDVPLSNVTVDDSNQGQIFGPTTLPRKESETDTNNCKDYTFSYYPSTLPTGDDAARITFRDQVTAKGDPPTGTGQTVTSDPVSAVCSLCPECPAQTCPVCGTSTTTESLKPKPHKKQK